MIHPAALVDSKAEIDDGVEIGPYCVIEKGVSISEGSRIGPHVIIREGTEIGKGCQIFQFASIGEAPQFLGYKGEKTSTTLFSFKLNPHIRLHAQLQVLLA